MSHLQLGPDLYRTNAYRMSGLSVDAAPSEIRSRLEQARILGRLGPIKLESAGPLPLQPTPGPDSVREAVQRLEDPEKRLIDALFWFWPSRDGENDTALKALAEGDLAAAREVWHAAGLSSGVARHNLAVLDHILALDLEQVQSPLDAAHAAVRDELWLGAMGHWKAVLEGDGFWDALRDRITAMNEPQLRSLDPRQLRAELPGVLLGINAQLAVRAAQQDRAGEAERHRKVMLASGLGHDAAGRALRHVLRPVREQLRRLCRPAATDAEIENWGAAMKLVAQVQTLPIDSEGREVLLDEIADIQGKLCWFCLRRRGEANLVVRVWLHGDVTRASTSAGREVQWRYVTIDVPQCRNCYEDHRSWEFRKLFNRIAPGVRPEAEKVFYPPIAKMMSEGWQMGSRPAGV